MILSLAGLPWLHAQSVEKLTAAHSGKLTWDQASATLRFTGSGSIGFAGEGERSFLWRIPPEVKHVRIGKGVTVNIDGYSIVNPNATLVSLREDSMTLRGTVTNALIKVNGYAGKSQKGKNLLTVCGTSEQRSTYDCLPPDSPLRTSPHGAGEKKP